MRKNKQLIGKIVKILIICLILFLILFPFYSMLVLSVIPEEVYIQQGFVIIPNKFTLDSFLYVFSNSALWGAFGISVLVTILGVAFNLILTITAAYVLTIDFPGKKIYISLIFIALFFDGGLIANYLVVKDLGLIDSIFAMILPVGLDISFLLLLTKAFRKIPKSVVESAKLDGANDIQILFKFYIPIAMPMISAIAMYYAVARWNEWYLGMLYVNKLGLQPLQLVLKNIISNSSPITATELMQNMGVMPFSLGIKMACTIITMIPILILFPFMQKKFLNNLSEGSTKE